MKIEYQWHSKNVTLTRLFVPINGPKVWPILQDSTKFKGAGTPQAPITHPSLLPPLKYLVKIVNAVLQGLLKGHWTSNYLIFYM